MKNIARILAVLFPSWALSMLFLWKYGDRVATGGTVALNIESAANDAKWAVALILTTSVALFNNSFKLFDKIETLYKARKNYLNVSEIPPALAHTENLSVNFLDNARAAIILGLLLFVIGLFRKLPTSLVPDFLIPSYGRYSLRLDWFAISLEVAVSVLIVAIMINQFKAVPTFIKMYRLLSEESLSDNGGTPPSNNSDKPRQLDTPDEEKAATDTGSRSAHVN